MKGSEAILRMTCAVLALWCGLAAAGTFTVSPWTSDADSGISAGKIYTHTGKFRVADGLDGKPYFAGNGVYFEGDRNLEGVNWRFFNVPSVFDGAHQTNVTGAGASLLTFFVYGDTATVHPQLQLTALEPGKEYVATFYAKGWEDTGRVIDVTADDPEGGAITIDQDQYGSGNGLLLRYHYTAGPSGQIIFTFDEQGDNMSWHHYAFSNEVAMPVWVNPEPYPGQFTDLTVTLDFPAAAAEGVTLVDPTYNLYWGADPNALAAVTDLSEPTYLLENLAEATQYHWQVEVFDEGEMVYTTDPNDSGRTWTFTTKSLAPAEKALQYSMDQEQGTVVPESIGGYDATAFNFDDPNDSSWTQGIVGNTLAFDGNDSYVDLGSEAPLPFGQGEAFSISGYVRTNDPAGPLVTFRNSETGGPIFALVIGYDGADNVPGRLRFIAREVDGAALSRLTGPVADDGGWNHFALTRGLDGEIALYVNGVSYGSVNDLLVGYDVDWRAIGSEIRWINDAHGLYDQRFLEGLIDEVVIWSGALRQDQIDEMVDLIPYRLNPTPREGAVVDLGTTLRWTVPFDRIEEPTYNVYIGTDPDLTSTIDGATGLTETEFATTEPMDFDTTYYWQVETVSGGEVVYTSPIWSFTTVPPTVGRFTVQPWTGDADSGLSEFKTYTHTGKFSGNAVDGQDFYAGNGVYFEGDTNHAGVNWTLTVAPNGFGATNGVNVSGDSGNLARGFFYGDEENNHPVLTLTGLTPGTKYVTTLYSVGFGGAGSRLVDITPSDNPGNPTRIDENGAGDANGQLVKYTFTAASDQISFTFDAVVTADSWHHYAFSNEVALPFDLVLSPAAGGQVGTDVELTWQDQPAGAATGAVYNLVVATDAELTQTVVDETGVPTMFYSPSGLEPDTQYYWQVEGVLDGEVVYVSAVSTFFTAPTELASVLFEWTMDDGEGLTVTETYMGQNGTLIDFADANEAWVDGVDGMALALEGPEAYVTLGDTTDMAIAEGFPFSIAGYFKTTDPEGPLFTLRTPNILGVYVGFDGADSVPGHLRFIISEGTHSRLTGPRVDDGRWHHFAITRSRFGQLEMIVDGVSYGTTNDGATAYTNTLGAFGSDRAWIEADGPGTIEQRFLEGQIDQITVWQGVLQPEQIDAMVLLLPILGDLNGDGSVNLADLLLLTGDWLGDAQPADIDLSGRVDYEDFGILSLDWGK